MLRGLGIQFTWLVATAVLGLHLSDGVVDCWLGDYNHQRCCDTELYGPEGDIRCWGDGFSYAQCCRSQSASTKDTAWSWTQTQTLDEGNVLKEPLKKPLEDGFVVSSSCWRGGFNFATCCTRSSPRGNPQCWDGVQHTYEKCCHPPEPQPAAFLLEDHNCHYDEYAWKAVQDRVAAIAQAADAGRLPLLVSTYGGMMPVARKLRRTVLALQASCPLGRIAVDLAALLLCLTEGGVQARCGAYWASTARTMRQDTLNIAQLAASRWPILGLFRHVANIVARDDENCTNNDDALWPFLHEEAKAFGVLSKEVLQLVYGVDGTTSFTAPCEAGHQFVASVIFNMCAKSEVRCVSSYGIILNYKLRKAAENGSELKRWLAGAGSWRLHDWQMHLVEPVMRHHFEVGLQLEELQALGVEPLRGGPKLCANMQQVSSNKFRILPAEVVGPIPDADCRARCGISLSPEGEPWAFFGALGTRPNLLCVCTLSSIPFLDVGNCSNPWDVTLQSMPALRLGDNLLAEFTKLGPEAPLFALAASSMNRMQRALPVFTTMVFGHMAKYIPGVFRNLGRLEMQNVVIYTLDEAATHSCRRSANSMDSRFRPVCLPGEGKTALQKYVIVLAYLVLGMDVFWFDFDAIWLQNPLPALSRAVEHERGVPGASVLAAIDFDSLNCVMNAFFLVKASQSMRLWLMALLQWLYKRPFVHDQVAFGLLLGIGPLIDDEPLPKPPVWSPLDPNVFANAARFPGLGFSSEVDDLVLFHFFDGWNSNMPDEVEQWATPVYKGVNLFEILYSGDDAAIKSAIEKSRLTPPTTLRDCSHMTSLGLGVELQSAGLVEIPT